MKKRKVLFVATVVKAHIMTFHIPYLKWYKDNGYETYVCAKNDYEDNEKCSIPYCDYFYNIPFERTPIKYNNLKAYNRLKEIINVSNFDIIHCHTPVGGALTRLAAINNKATVIYTAHGFHFYKGAPLLNWLLYYPLEKMLSKYTDVLLTINKEDYHRARKYKAKKVEYIPGVGLEEQKYNKVSSNKTLKRSEIGIPKDDFVVLSVGELNKNKNHEMIIRAISQLKNKQIKYIICGQGPLENYLKNIAKQLGVDDQVILLGFRSDINELCNSADLFVFPSFREGLSLSLMEAMASGLPVIASNIRGNSDLIENGKGGYLIDPRDVNECALKINQPLSNPQLREKMSFENKNKIKDYQIENVLNVYQNIIFHILKRS